MWKDIDKDVPFLDELQAQCDNDETGVIVVTKLSHFKSFPSLDANDDIHCDVLLISNKKGVHLITVVNGPPDRESEKYLKNVAETLDKNLKGFCNQGCVEQFILLHHVVPSCCTSISDIFMSDELPIPDWGVPHQLEEILKSLVVMLNAFLPLWSYFLECTGVEMLNLLTKDQCNMVWYKMHTHTKLFVHGLAGSGKTIMAMELMRRLVEKNGAASVLYLCNTVPLRNEVR